MFVVDSADKERLDEAQDLLEELLCNEELTGTPVVVVANKQDIEGITKMKKNATLPEHSLSRVVVPATLHSVTGTTTLDRE